MKFFLILLLFLPVIAKPQLPANFNLVANGNLAINQDFIFSDTVFNKSSCWVRAGKTAPTCFTNNAQAYWDIFSNSLVNYGALVTGAFLSTTGSNLVYVRSTNHYLDTVNLQRSQYAENILLAPLIQNQTYKFTVKIRNLQPTLSTWQSFSGVGAALGIMNSVKNIGAYFSTNQVKDYNNVGRLNYIPQINFTNWGFTKYDTLEVISLSGNYTAQGGEQFITIGNFDYFKNYVLNSNVLYYPTADTVQISDYKQIMEVSLVKDTTQPMISLSHFSLGNDTGLCPGNTLTIGGEPNFLHYWWSTGDTTRFITINDTGTYWCTVDFGCSIYTDTLHVFRPDGIGINLLQADTALCNLPFTLHLPQGLSNIQWNNNNTSDSIVVNNPGTYWVSGIYCNIVLRDTIQIIKLPTQVQLPPDTSICAGSNVSLPLNATQGFSNYIWSTGATSYNIIASDTGKFWVTANNACGSFSDTMQILSILPVQSNFPADTLVCNVAQTLTLSAPPGVTNTLWSSGTNSGSIIINTPGVYWFTADSKCGLITDTANVRFCAPIIQLLNVKEDSTICAGDCINYIATISQYPQTITWNFDGGIPPVYTNATAVQVCYMDTGRYTTRVIASGIGGADTQIQTIIVSIKPQPRFVDTSITVPYKTLLLLPSCTNAEELIWYNADSLVCSGCTSLVIDARNYRSTYRLVARNGGCIDSCAYKITVTDIPSAIYLPNAFTPNGDGLNDMFGISTDNPNVMVKAFSVFNRWGQQVFFTTNYKDRWDGKIKGSTALNGVYFWYIKYSIAGNDHEYLLKGDLTLLR